MTNNYTKTHQIKFCWCNILAIILLVIFTSHNIFAVNTDSLINLLPHQQGIEKATTLNILGEAFITSNPQTSIKYLNEAYQLTKNTDYKTEIFSISYLVDAYKYSRKYDSSDLYVEKGLIRSIEVQDTVRMMEFLTNIGWTYYYQGEYKMALNSFSEAMVFFNEYIINHPNSDDVDILNFARLLNNKASVYTKMGYYDSAIVNFKESLGYREKQNAGPEYIAPTLLNIGGVCFKNENYNLAITYFTDALGLYSKLNNQKRVASCYSNLGMASKALGDTIKAIEYFEKSLKIREPIDDIRGQIIVLNNLSATFLQTNQLADAKHNILQALSLNKNERYKASLAITLQNMGTYYQKTENYKLAIEYALKSLNIMKSSGSRSIYEDVYLLLSQAYEGLGNFEMALVYYKQQKLIHDSIFDAESRTNYNKLQLELETTKKEKEIGFLKKERENQALEHQILKNWQIATVLISLSIILLIAVIAISIYSKRKKDKQIHLQKEIVHRRENELSKSELEKSKLKEVELQQSILYKSKQLSTHALHMMQKNTMLHEMQLDIKTLSKKASIDDKPDFKRINLQINQSLRSHKDWDVFKLYFEDVNRNFYKKLVEINPELTTNDHRLCALIKLNMNSKEMASVLNVAPNSIKSSRYRLKKKLGLDAEVDLEEFIRGLA